MKVLASWKQYGVSALARGFLPAILGENEIKPLLAPLVGANPDEIAVMNHLSVNLHLLMNSFYAPKGKNYWSKPIAYLNFDLLVVTTSC